MLSMRLCSQRTNWPSTDRPSFSAASQVATPTHVTNKRGRLVANQFSSRSVNQSLLTYDVALSSDLSDVQNLFQQRRKTCLCLFVGTAWAINTTAGCSRQLALGVRRPEGQTVK